MIFNNMQLLQLSGSAILKRRSTPPNPRKVVRRVFKSSMFLSHWVKNASVYPYAKSKFDRALLLYLASLLEGVSFMSEPQKTKSSSSSASSDSQEQASSEVKTSAQEIPLNQTAAAESTETTSWRFDGASEHHITFESVDSSDSDWVIFVGHWKLSPRKLRLRQKPLNPKTERLLLKNENLVLDVMSLTLSLTWVVLND